MSNFPDTPLCINHSIFLLRFEKPSLCIHNIDMKRKYE